VGIDAAALAASLYFNGSSGSGGDCGDYGNDSKCGNEIENDTSNSNDNNGRSSNIVYDIYQGTAMGRPSLIQVIDLRREYDENDDDDDDENNCDSDENNNNSNNRNVIKDFSISFGLQGKVEIDDYVTIEVECDDDNDNDKIEIW